MFASFRRESVHADVVLHGYQGADCDAEQLALTEQLCDAAGELGVVARGQPCLIVGFFNVEPTRFLVCLKESRLSSGLIWKLHGEEGEGGEERRERWVHSLLLL